MNLEELCLIPIENVKKWNKLTRYCYRIGCMCDKCNYFPDEYKASCKVKLHVLLLCRKLGKPKGEY